MADLLQQLFGKRPAIEVAGIFRRQDAAEAMLEQLRYEVGLDRTQVRLLRPMDGNASH